MSEINAIRFAEPWQVSCVKIPMPEPKPGEALIKIMAAGICGSDIPRIYKTGTYSYPLIPGHEFSGTVIETGLKADKKWMGKRVGKFF